MKKNVENSIYLHCGYVCAQTIACDWQCIMLRASCNKTFSIAFNFWWSAFADDLFNLLINISKWHRPPILSISKCNLTLNNTGAVTQHFLRKICSLRKYNNKIARTWFIIDIYIPLSVCLAAGLCSQCKTAAHAWIEGGVSYEQWAKNVLLHLSPLFLHIIYLILLWVCVLFFPSLCHLWLHMKSINVNGGWQIQIDTCKKVCVSGSHSYRKSWLCLIRSFCFSEYYQNLAMELQLAVRGAREDELNRVCFVPAYIYVNFFFLWFFRKLKSICHVVTCHLLAR